MFVRHNYFMNKTLSPYLEKKKTMQVPNESNDQS